MGPKILTVDDSKTIRMIVARAFKPFACEILEASDGVEGLAVVSRQKPDIIILDYTMPVMDGTEMLGRLKSTPELRSIPVIMLTAEAGRENVLRIAKLGVKDYLVKPFKVVDGQIVCDGPRAHLYYTGRRGGLQEFRAQGGRDVRAGREFGGVLPHGLSGPRLAGPGVRGAGR